MPQDRFIHPCFGHSDKVTKLTDFEFRVWIQYLASSDDFGVMRASAVTLRADSDALDAKPERVVQRALEHVISFGLLEVFEHQSRRYVYQRDWQKYQKVEYPRPTMNPKPPAEALATCAETTRALFEKHPGGQGRKTRFGQTDNPTDVAPAPNVSQTAIEPHPTTRARAREEATATAQGSGSGQGNGIAAARTGHVADTATGDRAAALLERYPALYMQHRRGARTLIKPPLDFQRALDICRTWPDDVRIEKMAVIFLTTDEEWIARTDRGFGVFASKVSWCDDRLRAWEAEHGVTV